jgi:ankyrin repeat protein
MPLSQAAEKGHEAVVKLLLQTGKFEADAVVGYGRTVLLWASYSGHVEVVKLQLVATSLSDSLK